MEVQELFEKVGFIGQYRNDMEIFCGPFFDTKNELLSFFLEVFENDINDKTPRWMLNQLQRFVTLANDIGQIRPERDPLRVLF